MPRAVWWIVGLLGLLLPCVARADHDLIIWTEWNDPSRNAQFHEFELEHPGWHVISSTSGDMLVQQQRLLCGVAGGSPPDVVLISRHTISDWASRDAFLPLDSFIATSQRCERLAIAAQVALRRGDGNAEHAALTQLLAMLSPLGDCRQAQVSRSFDAAHADELVSLCQGVDPALFYPAVWGDVLYHGRPYAVPTDYDGRALYYNEDLLERAGIVDAHGKAKPPTTWAELKADAIKLTQRDARGRITQLGFSPNYGNSWLYLYGWQNGGRFMSADGRRCTMDDPRIVQALQYMVDVYDALGGIEQVQGFESTFQNAGSAFDPFFEGRIAMKVDGSWLLPNFADYAPNIRFNVVPAPVPAGQKVITWSGGFCLAVPAGGHQTDMAFELIRFLMSDRMIEFQARLAMQYAAGRGATYVPIGIPKMALDREIHRTMILDNPSLSPRIKQAANVFLDLASVARFRPATPVGQLLWDEHVRAYEKAVRHALTPQEALRLGRLAVQRELDAISQRGKATQLVNWFAIWLGVAVLCAVAGIVIYLLNGRNKLLRSLAGYESRVAYLCVSPWLIGLLVFSAGPMVASIVFSFCRYDVLHPASFVGLANYRELFSADPLVWKALANTGFMLLAVPLGGALGLAIALLLNKEVHGVRLYRTIFYLPAIVPAVASSILWLWILNPELGLLNTFLRLIGINHPPQWLLSSDWLFGARSGILLMILWGAGGGMVIWLAGLKGIPASLYEAAEIDGASDWKQFLHITVPTLSPYIFFNLIIGIIGTLQIFAQSYIMTQGGPDDSTMFYVYYLFNNAFGYFRMGYASALAWILFLIILVLSVIQMGLSKRWVNYDVD